MKDIQFTILTILTATLGIQAASASPEKTARHHHGFGCIQESWIPQSSSEKKGACTQTQALTLAQTEKVYPNLSGQSFKVQYWQGSFQKEVETTTQYLHDIYDECSQRSLVSEIVASVSTEVLEFKVANPNLSDSIDASYKLVPMTDGEAVSALAGALSECLK